MGIDVFFSRAKAIEAGMPVRETIRGNEHEINKAKEYDDPSYLQWLNKSIKVITVPGTEFHLEDGGADEYIVVRANPWGRVHGPLTQWLEANNIEYGEF